MLDESFISEMKGLSWTRIFKDIPYMFISSVAPDGLVN